MHVLAQPLLFGIPPTPADSGIITFSDLSGVLSDNDPIASTYKSSEGLTWANAKYFANNPAPATSPSSIPDWCGVDIGIHLIIDAAPAKQYTKFSIGSILTQAQINATFTDSLGNSVFVSVIGTGTGAWVWHTGAYSWEVGVAPLAGLAGYIARVEISSTPGDQFGVDDLRFFA